MNTPHFNTYSQSLAVSQPTVGLLAYYKLNNDLTDSVGVNHATTENTTFVSRLSGYALNYNVVQSRLTIPFSTDFDFFNGGNDLPFSVSMIIKYNFTVTDVYFAGNYRANSNASWLLFSSGTKLRLNLWDQYGKWIRVEVTHGFSSLQYHSLTMTYDGSSSGVGIKIYVDGVELSKTITLNGVYSSQTATSTDRDIVICTRSWQASSTIRGNVDDVAIWNKELTPLEVTDVHDKTINGIELI